MTRGLCGQRLLTDFFCQRQKGITPNCSDRLLYYYFKISIILTQLETFILHSLANCSDDIGAGLTLTAFTRGSFHKIRFIFRKMSTESWHKLIERKKRKNNKLVERKKKRKVSYEMPTLGFHVPEGSELEEKIISKAKRFHDGKVSAYVRKCVEKDLAGSLEVTSNTSLLDLARQFRPALVSRLERYDLEDQALILDRFLEAFADALKRSDFNPREPFAIANNLDALKVFVSDANFFRRLAVLASGGDAAAADKMLASAFPHWQDMQDTLAAERDQAPYTANHVAALAKQAATTPAPHTPPPTPPTPKPPGPA